MAIARSIKYLMEQARLTAKRFLFAILAAFLATVYSIYCVENSIYLDDAKLALTLILGIPLFFSFDLFFESKKITGVKSRLIGLVVGVILLTIYHQTILADDTRNFYLRFFQVNLAIHLLVSFIAFLNLHEDNGFWQLNKSFFLRFLTSFLYSSAFFTGIAIALLVISKLFSFEIKGERYLELWFISVLLLQTWHFFAGVPKNINGLGNDESYPRGLLFFVQYLLIPLLTLYMAILYVYMAKIVITWDWPKGYIGWLVSIISVLGIFNLLLLDPGKDKDESRWITLYSKYYYVLILPLLVMLFIAIGKRTFEYGITEKRYFLFVIGLLLLGLSMYFIFSKKKNIKWIPVSLFFVTILSLWGPWSAYNISFKSQYGRAERLLENNGLLVGSTTKKSTISISEEVQKELSSIFDYLIKGHGYDRIKNWFPYEVTNVLLPNKHSDTSLKARQQNSAALMEHLGLRYIP